MKKVIAMMLALSIVSTVGGFVKSAHAERGDTQYLSGRTNVQDIKRIRSTGRVAKLSTKFIKTKQSSGAPLAYQLYCLKNRRECSSGGSSNASYTASLAAKLRTVNSAVNAGMTYRSDKSDTWQANGRSGDCEDFALSKRHRLIGMGVPASSLRIAVVRNTMGEGHAVLVVRTTRGDLVLDNARSNIVHRRDTGYQWIAMSNANPMSWSRY